MQQSALFDENTSQAEDSARRKASRALLRVVQAAGADYEWYPTSEAEIQCIRADLEAQLQAERRYREPGKVFLSVCDVGAGDGRALLKLTEGKRFAIEKSLPLVEAMDKSIAIIGTDFHAQTLVDKRLDVIFCNPPYSEFQNWAQKIILEANAAVVYLIMPNRWVNSLPITEALAARHAEHTIIGSFDYASADREARAKVDIVRIKLGSFGYHGSESRCNVDPFSLWFSEAFPLDAPESEVTKWAREREQEEALKQSVDSRSDIVKREGLVRILNNLYQRDLNQLMDTYKAMSAIPADLLSELDINISNVKAGLKLKVTSLKDRYWKMLFNNLDSITDKLCSSTRKRLLDTLMGHTNVDFTESNAVAIVLWTLKMANQYFESQIIETFETLTETANVIKYKSNERTFQKGRWRYTREDFDDLGSYMLDYRIVLERVGGIDLGNSWSSNTSWGLSSRATDLVSDLVTMANNLGLDSIGNTHATARRWVAGKPQVYYFYNHQKQQKEILFEAKAFRNGNLHLKLCTGFIQRLNCIHGRLKGWLKTPADAVYEMNVPQEVAEEAFHVQLSLTHKQVPLLIGLA